MNQGQLQESIGNLSGDSLGNLPLVAILGLGLAYLGFNYYQFINDPGSELMLKQGELTAAQAEHDKLSMKIKKANEFVRTLEGRKVKLREMARQLDEFKSSLSENLDVPELLKLVTTEGRKVGLLVTSLEPKEKKAADLYLEQSFEMKFRGVFVQFLVFLDRLSQAQRIVHVESFTVKPLGSSQSRFVELEGAVQLKAYAYKRSNSDSVARETAPAPTAEMKEAKKGGT